MNTPDNTPEDAPEFTLVESPNLLSSGSGRAKSPLYLQIEAIPPKKCLQWRTSKLSHESMVRRVNSILRPIRVRHKDRKFAVRSVTGGLDIHRLK